MKREDMVRQMHEALDSGRLEDPPEELRAALESDAELRAMWEELTSTERMLRSQVRDRPAPRGLHERIMSAVDAAQADETGGDAAAGKRRVAPVWLAAAAAVIVALAVAFGSILSGPSPTETERHARVEPEPAPGIAESVEILPIPEIRLARALAAPRERIVEARSEISATAQSFYTFAVNAFTLPEVSRQDRNG